MNVSSGLCYTITSGAIGKLIFCADHNRELGQTQLLRICLQLSLFIVGVGQLSVLVTYEALSGIALCHNQLKLRSINAIFIIIR